MWNFKKYKNYIKNILVVSFMRSAGPHELIQATWTVNSQNNLLLCIIWTKKAKKTFKILS